MSIQSSSWKLSLAARLCRLFPPGFSGVFLRMYPTPTAIRENATFEARSALADFRYRCRKIDHVANVFAIRGFFDWQNALIASACCESGNCIVEIGANIGTETLVFSRAVGSAGRVICFEPVPANIAQLREQLALNQIDNVELVEAAVSDQPGRIRFSAPADAENSGQGAIADATSGAGADTFEVECKVLDAMYASGDLGTPRLVVMDVQGAELLVLRGATNLLRTVRPTVVLEVETDALKQFGMHPRDITAYFHAHQYRCWKIGKWGLSPANPEAWCFDNWLALPNRPDERADGEARRIGSLIRRAALLPLIRGLNPAVAKCRN